MRTLPFRPFPDRGKVEFMKTIVTGLLLLLVCVSGSGYAQDKAPYRGSSGRISMNVEEADVRVVLRSISEFSGMNIVAGSEVKGPVTVLLHDVPWRDALESVLRMNDFVAIEEGNVIRVATHKDFEAAAKMQALQTEIYEIKYARAETLQLVVTKLLSERGKSQADARANALIISDIPRVIVAMDSVISALDRPTAQVLIESKIIEMDASTTRELGVNWNAGNLNNPHANTRVGGEVNVPINKPHGSVTFGRLENGVDITATLSALEESKKANVLSQPSVLINDNEEATVVSGKRIPINILDRAGNLVTQFFDVAVKLTVTPHINPKNEVMMSLKPEVSELSGESTVAGGVIILTSEVSTTLLVKDGETVVIGGVIRSKEGTVERHIPLLHAIPLFGRLFSYSAKTVDKTEIVIFVTPHVIPVDMVSK